MKCWYPLPSDDDEIHSDTLWHEYDIIAWAPLIHTRIGMIIVQRTGKWAKGTISETWAPETPPEMAKPDALWFRPPRNTEMDSYADIDYSGYDICVNNILRATPEQEASVMKILS